MRAAALKKSVDFPSVGTKQRRPHGSAGMSGALPSKHLSAVHLGLQRESQIPRAKSVSRALPPACPSPPHGARVSPSLRGGTGPGTEEERTVGRPHLCLHGLLVTALSAVRACGTALFTSSPTAHLHCLYLHHLYLHCVHTCTVHTCTGSTPALSTLTLSTPALNPHLHWVHICTVHTCTVQGIAGVAGACTWAHPGGACSSLEDFKVTPVNPASCNSL